MLNNQDIIDSYLRGELSELERSVFEQNQNIDKSLKSDFELTKIITESLKERVSMYECMSEWEKESPHEVPSKKISKIVRNFLISGSIAASLILVFLMLKPVFSNSGMEEGQEKIAFNMPYFNSSDYLSEDYKIYEEKIDSLLNSAEYEEAMKLIFLIESDFIGLSNESSNIKFEKAGIDNDESNTHTKYLNDTYILKWRKINTLFALDKKNEAVALLKNFKEEKGKFQEDALKLYDNMTQGASHSDRQVRQIPK